MAAIIVGMAVMAVVMTAAMPVWKQMVQREKEEELVFRGEQYAHAIGMFQRRTATPIRRTSTSWCRANTFARNTRIRSPTTTSCRWPIRRAGRSAAPNPDKRDKPVRQPDNRVAVNAGGRAAVPLGLAFSFPGHPRTIGDSR